MVEHNNTKAMEIPKHILIILHGAIGDVARGVALAVQIKRQWPSCRITWAVEPISRSLVEHHPSIDRVVVFQRGAGLKGYLRFIRELRQDSYDVCLDLQRHFKSGFTSLLSGASKRIGFDKGNSREGNWMFQTQHIATQVRESPKIVQFFAFLDALGIARSEPIEFQLEPSTEQQSRIDALIGLDAGASAVEHVALLIGSTWTSRVWPTENYIELARALWQRYRLRSIIVGGPADAIAAAAISSELLPEQVVNLVGKTSLRDLSAVFTRARLAIGSDSGPMHIAAAVATPIISLWGSTSPVRSGPYGWEGYCLQSAIGCAPCYQRVCPGLDTLCMRALSTEIVLSQVERLFDELQRLK